MEVKISNVHEINSLVFFLGTRGELSVIRGISFKQMLGYIYVQINQLYFTGNDFFSQHNMLS